MTWQPDIIYFGGTFDPVHLGHVEAVTIAHEVFPGSKITLVPSYDPRKNAVEAKAVDTAFIDRVAMCVVAFDEFSYVDVSSIEEDLDAPSYTIQTLKALRSENPELKVAWMIGADQLDNFPRWKSPREILELAALIVLPRKSVPMSDLVSRARDVIREVGCGEGRVDGNVVEFGAGGRVIVLHRAPMDVSSTGVRQIAARDIRQAAALVPASVVDYIVDLELYQA
jgi:nicotinate-nucleotide adenylyltransferase